MNTSDLMMGIDLYARISEKTGKKVVDSAALDFIVELEHVVNDTIVLFAQNRGYISREVGSFVSQTVDDAARLIGEGRSNRFSTLVEAKQHYHDTAVEMIAAAKRGQEIKREKQKELAAWKAERDAKNKGGSKNNKVKIR